MRVCAGCGHPAGELTPAGRSIVNGLRGEDTESIYQRRISAASELSAYTPDGEVEQLFFKEHVRTGSKGSTNSFLSRKRNPAPGKVDQRPETKVGVFGLAAERDVADGPVAQVFFSSSAHIARLIEKLSSGADAGSFNIQPHGRGQHSHSGSLNSEADMHWTVEERLEHMLGTMAG